MHRTAIATAAALGTLLLAAPTYAETLRLGVVSALSGPGSAWGLAVDGGVRIAAKEINAAGGLKVGGKTYTIEVTSYDDKYKAADGVTAATRLIEQDGIKYIFGPLGSASMLAVKPLYEQNEILALVNSYSDKVLDKNTKNIYRVLPTTREFIEPMVKWVKQHKPGLTNVAVISPNDETGWASQALQKEYYAKHGFKIIASELFERSLKDFQPLLTRMIAAKPDIIELDTTPPPTAGLIIRQARELGYKGAFVKIGGPGVPEIVNAAGKDFAEGTIVYVGADASDTKYKWLESEYQKLYPPPMNSFNVFFYDAANMLFESMRKAGTVGDVKAVRAALEKITPFKGMQGTLSWTGKAYYGSDHQLLVPVFVGMIENGEEKVVTKIDQ
ncbi:MAG: ABC transporter substrate-binding protein [Hyphomicrobiaceae bacterium]|nr:ABC transporter substrate-binding protein [Hyphomicrobiaceae bacterium]